MRETLNRWPGDRPADAGVGLVEEAAVPVPSKRATASKGAGFPGARATSARALDVATRESALTLLTVGHGTTSREEFTTLIQDAGVEALVDVRSVPGSRHNPQFGRRELEEWMPGTGIAYRWEPDLGGFRRGVKDSTNVTLRHPAFRAYADYMASDPFQHALSTLLADAARRRVCVMCAETLWFRCHRRLIADAATLLYEAQVLHLDHRGKLLPHSLTEGARRRADDLIVYDAAVASPT
jgi:uncharacterized protein (DUF488 family)